MLKRKNIKERGKISFTKFFQPFKAGDSVAVVRDLTVPFGYSNRIQGRTGKVIEKRGDAYYIKVKEMNKEKYYNLHPIHLKKIEDIK